MSVSAETISAPAGLRDILITPQLSRRKPRPADHAAENRALGVLAREMTNNPENLLSRLVEMAVELCGAESAGISLLRKDAEGEFFSWDALAGSFAGYAGGRSPRGFSPCGTTVDRGSAQLFLYPGRYFDYLQAFTPPIVEGLVIPFYAKGQPLGTIWIVSQDENRHFDAEDARIMTSLGELTGAALQMQSSLNSATAAGVELEQTTAELRQVNQSLRATEQWRQEADRRKDEFLATLSHELRNPLAPIRNALHILRMKKVPQARERALEIVDRQVSHLVRLVDDLLEVSRITRGKLELRREPLALERAVLSAIETSRPLIEAAGHELTVRLAGEPLTVEADLVRLSQVISNLLNNAAKYTEPGGRIELTTAREGGQAVVRIRDSGIGIPADKLRGVFEMFTQLDGSKRQSQGGLGIGLALVRSLVQMHGGAVEAESDGPGRGSVFTVRLPLLGADHETANGEAERARCAALPATRILVVDDNRDAADSLGMLLELLGSEVRVVHDGPAALREIEAFRPAVVLLDIGMPGMDGHEVARKVRERSDAITLIAVTGWGQEEDHRRSQEAGFDHHLVKPVDLDALRSLLTAL